MKFETHSDASKNNSSTTLQNTNAQGNVLDKHSEASQPAAASTTASSHAVPNSALVGRQNGTQTNADDPVSEVRAAVKIFSEVYAAQAEEIYDFHSVSDTYAVNVISEILNNEISGWVVIGMIAYKKQQETTPHPGGSGQKVDPEEGRKNAVEALARACRANGTPISWQTLYKYARNIRIFLEEPLTKLKDPILIKEARTAALLDLAAVPGRFLKIAAKAKNASLALKKLTSAKKSGPVRQPSTSTFVAAIHEVAAIRGLKPKQVAEDFFRIQSCANVDFRVAYRDLGVRK